MENEKVVNSKELVMEMVRESVCKMEKNKEAKEIDCQESKEKIGNKEEQSLKKKLIESNTQISSLFYELFCSQIENFVVDFSKVKEEELLEIEQEEMEQEMEEIEQEEMEEVEENPNFASIKVGEKERRKEECGEKWGNNEERENKLVLYFTETRRRKKKSKEEHLMAQVSMGKKNRVHPSWREAKKRKEREKNAKWEGKRIKFE